jgi:glycosyltransferase involved in cell wall biosynthesis
MLALFLIVKNEARIIRRCLEAARPFVDRVLVVDTGSEDDTASLCDEATVVHQKWVDFGTNRTQSFRAVAEHFPGATWAITLDADMRLCGDASRFRELLEKCDAAGCSLLQINHGTEYYNIRVMRVDRPWVCKGATHEYWCCRGGTVHEVPRDIAYIEDLGDGGCKSDKFERDERLLRRELEEEPDKERDYFYLANTLLCQGKREEAAEWYKKRVEAGAGTKVYFSCYQLARIHADRPIDSEYWAQRPNEATPNETRRGCSSSSS